MSYELSFSPEFFYSQDPIIDLDQPYSVEMAIHAMSTADHIALADAMDMPVKYLTAELIMDRVHKTDTCSNLDSPVQVWIDSEGYHTIAVHEAPRHIPDLDSPQGSPGYTPSLCGAETGEVVAWLDRDFVANCKKCKARLQEQA